MRRCPRDGGERRRAVARGAWSGARKALSLFFLLPLLALLGSTLEAQHSTPIDAQRLDRGRFTIVCYPGDEKLAEALLARALTMDSFPGIPRPSQRVLIAIAPDQRRFREWAGPGAPEWARRSHFPTRDAS